MDSMFMLWLYVAGGGPPMMFSSRQNGKEKRNGGKKNCEMAGRYNTTKYITRTRAEDVRYRTGQEDFWRTSWSRCISFSAFVITGVVMLLTLNFEHQEVRNPNKIQIQKIDTYAATRPAALFTNPPFPIPSHRLHTHPSNTYSPETSTRNYINKNETMGGCCSCLDAIRGGKHTESSSTMEMTQSSSPSRVPPASKHGISRAMSAPTIQIQGCKISGCGLALGEIPVEQDAAYWEYHVHLPGSSSSRRLKSEDNDNGDEGEFHDVEMNGGDDDDENDDDDGSYPYALKFGVATRKDRSFYKSLENAEAEGD